MELVFAAPFIPVLVLFVENGTTASCLKVQQMVLVNNGGGIPRPNFLYKSHPSAICRIESETRSTKRIGWYDRVVRFG